MIVIVNWNSGSLLDDCLLSVRRSTDIKIIVVDNGSSDDSDKVVSKYKNTILISKNENIGFAAACNEGAKFVTDDYILFLNPDAALYNNTIQKTIEFMNNSINHEYVVCGVRLVDESGKVQRGCARFRTPVNIFLTALGVTKIFPSFGYSMQEWDHLDSREVDHVIGAYYFIRNKTFIELGGFDERFFVYLEDLDLSKRIKQMGYKSYYLTETSAYHLGGGTSSKNKSGRLFYAARSNILYAKKHFNFLGFLTVLFTFFIIEPFTRSIFAVLRGSFSSFKDTWRGYLMLLLWVPRWLFNGVTR